MLARNEWIEPDPEPSRTIRFPEKEPLWPRLTLWAMCTVGAVLILALPVYALAQTYLNILQLKVIAGL